MGKLTKKNLLQFVIYSVIFLFSCEKSHVSALQYVNGRQLLTLNEIDEAGQKITRPKIGLIAPDSIPVGDEFLAKIFLTDTTTFSLDGCKSKLFSEADTILLAFKPQTSGTKTFQQIKIITRDKRRILRTLDYSFDYTVVDN